MAISIIGSQIVFAQSAGAVEYIDCTAAVGYDTPLQWVSWYDTKQSDGEVPVMLGLWGIWSTPSLPLLPGPLRPGMVALDRALYMAEIELTAYLC